MNEETLVTLEVLASLVVCLLMFISLWRIFDKAEEGGWKTLIPIYNSIVLYRIAWGSGWKFLLSCIPFIGWIFQIIVTIKLSKSFGHGVAFGIGLLLLPFIYYPILAFSNDHYLGPEY